MTVGSWAKPGRAQGQDLRFEQLTEKDGLSSNSVRGVTQDHKGFLWFGTTRGLNRYDGYEFRHYFHNDSIAHSLSDDYARVVVTDQSGTLWIGTNTGGLNRFDHASERFTAFKYDRDDPHSLSHNSVTAIYEDTAGTLWVGTREGLNRFDPATGQFIRYQQEPDEAHSLSHNYVSAICEDRQGRLWVGTFGGGLNRLDPTTGRFTRFQHDSDNPHSLSEDRVISLYEDSEGVIWISSWAGLSMFDAASEHFVHYRHDSDDSTSLSDHIATSIFEDQAGILWVGTFEGGLNKFDRASKRFTVYKNKPGDAFSLGYNHIYAMHQDQTGVYWIATAGGGINRFTSPKQLKRYDTTHRLSHNQIRSVYEDRQGTVWVGTVQGLDKFERAREQFISYPLGIVSCMYEDEEGMLWVGTYDGLFLFDRTEERFTPYRHDGDDPNSLSHNQVSALYQDSAGSLWVGTREGLNKLDRTTGHFVRYRHDDANPHSLSDDYVHAIAQDRAGALLIATNKGIDRFDPASDAFREIASPRPSSLALNEYIINTLYEDPAGMLWIGSFSRGLFRYNPEQDAIDVFNENNGLPSNNVRRILGDDLGDIWVLTTRGLARFDPQTNTFTGFDINEVLQGSETTAILNEKGEIFFGGEQGLVIFNPKKIKNNLRSPPVVITDIQVMNKPAQLAESVTSVKAIKLSHNRNFITFKYAALDYTDPEKNQYRYKLEGYYDAWIKGDQGRMVSYPNLPPGSYTFRVVGSNNNGIWNEEGASLVVTIPPPFWQTWWFWTLMGSLVLGLVVGAFQYRIYHLRREERTRQRIADDLHDDIGSKMSSIALDIEMAGRLLGIDGVKLERLDEVAGTARAVVDDLRDTVWIVDADHDNLGDLIARMKQVTGALLQGRRHRFYKPDPTPDVPLTMEQRRHLFLFFKEALHNAARHAGAAYVEVRVEYEAGQLIIEVQDDGIGFDGETVSRGRGLTTMRKRAEEELHGSFDVESAPGQGATVRLTARIA